MAKTICANTQSDGGQESGNGNGRQQYVSVGTDGTGCERRHRVDRKNGTFPGPHTLPLLYPDKPSHSQGEDCQIVI